MKANFGTLDAVSAPRWEQANEAVHSAVRPDGDRTVLLFGNSDWYLYNFRLGLMRELKARGYEVIAVSPAGSYAELIEKEGIRWLEVPMSRSSLNPFSELGIIRRLFRVYRSEAPDVVHHFTIKCVVYGSIAARFCRKPVCVNAVAGLGTVFTHDSNSSEFLKKLVKHLLRFAMAGSRSQLILQNPDDARLFEDNRLAKKECTHVIRGSGVDGTLFRDHERTYDSDRCRLLFAARLLRAKGIDNFVRAAERLAAPGATEFLVAGSPDSGNPDTVTDEQLAAWRDGKAVTVLGHVDGMQSLLKSIDVVVLPSVYGEGVPRILVEGAASGLPLVAFDVPGSREIVINGENGFLIEPGNQQALETALGTLIRNPALRHRMGRASRRVFEQEFEQSIVVSKTLNVYDLAFASI